MTATPKKPLRDSMPKVAGMVDARRAEWGAAHVDACIKAAMAGQPDQFYAVEAGHVLGTPFTLSAAMSDVALAFMVGGAAMVMRQPGAAK